MPETPLFVPLATAPWQRFHEGVKTVEIRQLKRRGRWNGNQVYRGRRVRLVKGYNPDNGCLYGTVRAVATAESIALLPAWAKEGAYLGDVQITDRYRKGAKKPKRYFDPYLPVIAFMVDLPSGARALEPW